MMVNPAHRHVGITLIVLNRSLTGILIVPKRLRFTYSIIPRIVGTLPPSLGSIQCKTNVHQRPSSIIGPSFPNTFISFVSSAIVLAFVSTPRQLEEVYWICVPSTPT
jgi:hypothetical protein